MKVQPKKSSPRRRARECAVQALYSWYISQNSIDIIELNFVTEQEMKGVDLPYFRTLLRHTVQYIDDIENILSPYLDRDMNELDPIERAILCLASYELKFQLDVPYKVVINEAIEVAKVFGAEESHKYINGVLDKIAPVLSRK
ncbi:transcription antitermination factor NusB [Seminibacterium arietis]|uniref:Transcription antitermination protein NusB n=1 Tax=Seminibacterium arietis TaxID=1173502 RepID=A0ABW3IAL2_9PAST